METSFYHYLMTERDPHKQDDITKFANAAFNDHMFPKQSEDYDEISTHLEMNADYLQSMIIFDDAWQIYKETKNKKQQNKRGIDI